jgi:hypothetical protein
MYVFYIIIMNYYVSFSIRNLFEKGTAIYLFKIMMRNITSFVI